MKIYGSAMKLCWSQRKSGFPNEKLGLFNEMIVMADRALPLMLGFNGEKSSPTDIGPKNKIFNKFHVIQHFLGKFMLNSNSKTI